MPIYEYSCPECGKEFEKLVGPQVAVACPACASGRVIRRISLVGVRTGGLGASASSGEGSPGACCGGGCGCR
jgi:putative FmdB family regulatory protein